MIHNFDQSLEHERNQTIKADTFYRDVLNAIDIKRFDTDSEADMDKQRQDVDLIFTLNNITYKVSEKFRDKDYGDLYVEVFSKFPKTKGWLETGSPNAIIYFTPNSVYWITHKSLAEFCLKSLFPAIPHNWYVDLYQSNKTIVSKYLKIESKIQKLNIIQAHNSLADGSKWETIGISAPFSFFENNGVKIKKWKL